MKSFVREILRQPLLFAPLKEMAPGNIVAHTEQSKYLLWRRTDMTYIAMALEENTGNGNR